MNPRFRTFALGLALLFSALPVSRTAADVMYLRNKQVVKGTVVRQNRSTIWMRGEDGTVTSYQKADVRRVSYSSPAADKAEREREESRRRAEAARKEAEQRKAEERRREQERGKKEPAASTKAAEREQSGNELWSAIWRSALLPGWGQYNQERPGYAIGYGGAFVTLFLAAGAANKTYRSRTEAYRTSSASLFTAAFASTDVLRISAAEVVAYAALDESRGAQSAARRRMVGFGAGALALYAWNLFDVWSYRPESGPAKNAALRIHTDGQDVLVGFHMRF